MPQGSRIQFVRLEREDHRGATFLDDRYLKPDLPRMTIEASAVATAMQECGPAVAPLGFLFHSSFALSTLATRLFDAPGLSMGLKEPVILNDIAWLARRSGAQAARPLLGLALRLLARPLAAGEGVVVKPSNVANRLIPDMLALCPGTPAVLMTSSLRDFLLSTARKGMRGRIEARRLFLRLREDGMLDAGFTEEDLFQQTDLQIAAMAWMSHRKQFTQLLSPPANRLRSLDSAIFLARREAVVAALGRHFGVTFDVAAIVAGQVFREHAKELGRGYDADLRARENAAVEALHGEEIGMIETWAAMVAANVAVPLDLPAPLVQIGA